MNLAQCFSILHLGYRKIYQTMALRLVKTKSIDGAGFLTRNVAPNESSSSVRALNFPAKSLAAEA
jgi:hypothetical protein